MYHEHYYIYDIFVSHRLLRTHEPRVTALHLYVCAVLYLRDCIFLFYERW